MRSGFKRSLNVMASLAAASMMAWSKGFMAQVEALPPSNESYRPHSFARKARFASDAGEGKQGHANRALVAAYKANPMNYLPGRDTVKLMKIKDYGRMMKAAHEALDAYRANGQCLDKVQPRRAPWSS